LRLCLNCSTDERGEISSHFTIINDTPAIRGGARNWLINSLRIALGDVLAVRDKELLSNMPGAGV
jgi:hypothetical protein